MEVIRKKNQGTTIVFPMVDDATPTSFKSGLSPVDVAHYKDGAGSWTALPITAVVTEIASDASYSLVMTDAEINHDLIKIKITASGAADTMIIIRTYAVDIEDMVRATTPANTLDVEAGGTVGVDFDNINGTHPTVPLVTTLSGHTPQTGDSFTRLGAPDGTNISEDIRKTIDFIESQRGTHTVQGMTYYVGPTNGNDTTGDGTRALPWATVTKALTAVTDNNHDCIMLLGDNAAGVTTLDESVTISKNYVMIRGPGRDFIWTYTGGVSSTIEVTGEGVELSGFRVSTYQVSGNVDAVDVTGEYVLLNHLWFEDARSDGVDILNANWPRIFDCSFNGAGNAAGDSAIRIRGSTTNTMIKRCLIRDQTGSGIVVSGTTVHTLIEDNNIDDCSVYGVDIQAGTDTMIFRNLMHDNASGNINDNGTETTIENSEQWATETGLDALNDITATDVWSAGTRTLTSFGTLINDIWHQLLTSITTVDSIGKLIKDNLDTTISSRGTSDLTAAEVNAEVDAALVDYDPPTKTEMDSGFAGLNDLSSAEATSAAETAIDNKLPAGETEVAAAGTTAKNLDAITASVDVNAIADAVWDELLTASTHNIATSAGRRLRQIVAGIVHEGTAQGPGTGTNQIQLDVGASATDGAYDPAEICIVDGTGLGQSRMILEYKGSTTTATVDRDWKVVPDATSQFVIGCHPGRNHVNEGLARGGTNNTITLNTLASAFDGVYIGQIIFIRSGTGADQAKVVIGYTGTSRVAIVDSDWVVNPDTSSAYVMLPYQVDTLTEIGEAVAEKVWDDPLSGHTTPGTTGKAISDMLARIGAFIGSSDNTILGFFRALIRKDVTAPSDVGGTYNPATDSNEAIRDRGDAEWITGGSSGGGANNFNIIVKRDNTSGPLLVGIDVQVMDVAETTTYTRQDTNSDGLINVDLDNGSYHVYLRNQSAYITVGGNPITLTVSDDIDQEEYMEAFDPGTPAAPDLCRVTNWHIDGSGVAEVGKTWSGKITVKPTISGDSVVSYKAQPSTVSDAAGYNYLDLIQTAVYEVNIDGNKYTITIPAESTKKLKALLPAP